jgi:hypothetical protein
MAVFPSLNPSGTRTYTAGDYPHTVYTGLSGDQSRVRHSAVMTGSAVNLSFSGLSEADMLSILSHYQGQLGNYYAFTLPSIAFAGMVDAAVFTLSRYQWRYQAPPVVNDLPCGTHTVDVQLISVAPEPVATAGARLVVVASIGLTPVVSTSGLTATVTASIEYGAGSAAGLAETITITLAAGTASGDTEALGGVFIVPIFLTPGAAFAANGLAQTVTASFAGGSATGSSAGATLTVIISLSPGAGISESSYFINYPNFASTSGLSLVSIIGVTNNYIYLTQANTGGDVGNVWTNSTRAYNSNFSVEWVFECSGGGTSSADGFTLQWHTANNVNGDSGGSCGRVSSTNVIHAISFRTFVSNSVSWHSANTLQTNVAQAISFRQNVYYWADYNHSQSTMKIYYSTGSSKPGSATHTFTSFSFNSTAYYMGFGAATGAVTDNHILKSWKAFPNP